MRAIAQGHEWQQRPLIINSRIGPLLSTKPVLDFRASVDCKKGQGVSLAQSNSMEKGTWVPKPSMMEAHHSYQRDESIAATLRRRHCAFAPLPELQILQSSYPQKSSRSYFLYSATGYSAVNSSCERGSRGMWEWGRRKGSL